MSLIDKLNEKAMGSAGKLIKKKIDKTIKNLIKDKRLAYLDNDMVGYIPKHGDKRQRAISLDEMAMILVDASGSENLLNVGIMPDDVRNMLVEAKGGK